MIYSGYSLHLYCDTLDYINSNAISNGDSSYAPGEFSDENKMKCFKAARKSGWLIDLKTRKCFCPSCSKLLNKNNKK